MTEFDLGAIRHLGPGQEIDCDKAFITDKGVYVRSHGTWIELHPISGWPKDSQHGKE